MKRKVKNPARLVLFFSLCFALVLLSAILIRFLEVRTDELQTVPAPAMTKLPGFISALQWALAPALYLSILLGLSYTSRKGISIPLSVLSLTVLSLAAVLGISLGIERLRRLPGPALPSASAPASPGTVLGEKGLILSRSGAAMILLKGPADVRGPRVVSLPGQPLIYQELPLGPNNTVLSLPPLPFRNERTPFLTSLLIDLSLTAEQLRTRQQEGLLSLAVYAASLILLLTSLRFVPDIGSWPLAGLFLGALIFRGILGLETFLNAREIQEQLSAFLGERCPPSFISPLIFCTLGLLILLYTALVHLVKDRRVRGA